MPEYPAPHEQNPVRRMQEGHQQAHENLDPRQRLLCGMFQQPVSAPRNVPHHQQAGLPAFRGRLDCRLRAPHVRGTREVALLLFCRHGFGNWSEIAEFMGTSKTREEVEHHYTTVYLESPNFIPVPISVDSRTAERYWVDETNSQRNWTKSQAIAY